MIVTEVKVLIEGYAKEIKGGWLASSTVVLIRDGLIKIIVDPGINRSLLLEKLKQEKLTTNDIDYVFLTHYHPDHAFLAAIFEKALILDGDIIYSQDRENPYQKTIPKTNIQSIPTPGHAHEHYSLLVPTKKGKIAIAGDVFWWADNEEQKTDYQPLLSHKDPFVKDEKALRKSRQKLLSIADWIIPGHGKMFQVK